MSVYLFQRLRASGRVSQQTLIHAMHTATIERTSLVESLVRMDVSFAPVVADCVALDSEMADESWRPDPRLLMDLPPGICERYLAFPYRERAGRVEVATVCPGDDSIRLEFEQHLGRGIILLRGTIQALLAAAGAPVDFGALNRYVRASNPSLEEAPIPLVRKSQGKEKYRERTPTAPGLGKYSSAISLPSGPPSVAPDSTARPPTWISPEAAHQLHLGDARDMRELAQSLCSMLPAPALVFELRDARLTLRRHSGPGAYRKESVSLVLQSALLTAVEEGNYLGPWYDCPVHARFSTSYAEGTLVRIERIGSADRGLVIVMVGEFDARRAAGILDQCAETWLRLTSTEH